MASTLLLKEIPEDIKRFIVKIQGEVKNEKGIAQYSMEKSIYKIIREHPSFNNSK